MNAIFEIGDGGVPLPISSIRCSYEDKELQTILEKNPNLLPGDQIDPDDPRRWFLIKREMPVPDPSSGVDRWSIDFLFVDQDAIPTFVECKRYADTRSRREVVGQMLEYIANGHYYWTKDQLARCAAESAGEGTSIDAVLSEFLRGRSSSPSDFFEAVVNNLQQAQVRLIFFMEESPFELRSVVTFLNQQMERSEVLIVEAKQFQTNAGTRIVVPSLFGYTEEARRVKKAVSVTSGGSRTRWTREALGAEFAKELTPEDLQLVTDFRQVLEKAGFDVSLSAGKTGGFVFRHPAISKNALFVLYVDGTLALYFGYMNDDALTAKRRDFLRNEVVRLLNKTLPLDVTSRYPSIQLHEWRGQALELANVVKGMLTIQV